jgi:two-component system, OmpR family, sensor histidine kinase KdpD
MPRHVPRLLRLVIVPVLLLGAATAAVTVLEQAVGVANASSVYLVAVVLAALLAGTAGAVVTAVGSALVYNYLFTEPRFTLAIHDPGVLLSVVLLLFVGIVTGELAALQRQRADAATAREREARALFGISRSLATRDSMAEALRSILAALATEAGLDRAWVGFGAEPSMETVAADTGDGAPPAAPGRLRVLQRAPGDQPARWVLVQRPGGARTATTEDTYRIRIEASGEPLGSIWATRARDDGEPDRVQTRLLAAAADQVGQAVSHERAAAQRREAEIARQSDALKTALLQSVSHDLRTPLATIRAAVGSLRPGGRFTDDDRTAGADAIEREVAYLDRLVRNLLDLSRIEAGALRANRDVFDLDDLLARALQSVRGRLGERTLAVDLASSPVEVDPVFVDEAVTNVLDNAVRHTPDGSRIRVTSRDRDAGTVLLTVDDDGPGVAPELRERLFEKFYRAPRSEGTRREGTGIGLSVARGLVEASGGSVTAREGELGGLAVDIALPAHHLAAVDAARPTPIRTPADEPVPPVGDPLGIP